MTICKIEVHMSICIFPYYMENNGSVSKVMFLILEAHWIRTFNNKFLQSRNLEVPLIK